MARLKSVARRAVAVKSSDDSECTSSSSVETNASDPVPVSNSTHHADADVQPNDHPAEDAQAAPKSSSRLAFPTGKHLPAVPDAPLTPSTQEGSSELKPATVTAMSAQEDTADLQGMSMPSSVASAAQAQRTTVKAPGMASPARVVEGTMEGLVTVPHAAEADAAASDNDLDCEGVVAQQVNPVPLLEPVFVAQPQQLAGSSMAPPGARDMAACTAAGETADAEALQEEELLEEDEGAEEGGLEGDVGLADAAAGGQQGAVAGAAAAKKRRKRRSAAELGQDRACKCVNLPRPFMAQHFEAMEFPATHKIALREGGVLLPERWEVRINRYLYDDARSVLYQMSLPKQVGEAVRSARRIVGWQLEEGAIVIELPSPIDGEEPMATAAEMDLDPTDEGWAAGQGDLEDTAFRGEGEIARAGSVPGKTPVKKVYLPSALVNAHFQDAAFPLALNLQVERAGVLLPERYQVRVSKDSRQGSVYYPMYVPKAVAVLVVSSRNITGWRVEGPAEVVVSVAALDSSSREVGTLAAMRQGAGDGGDEDAAVAGEDGEGPTGSEDTRTGGKRSRSGRAVDWQKGYTGYPAQICIPKDFILRNFPDAIFPISVPMTALVDGTLAVGLGDRGQRVSSWEGTIRRYLKGDRPTHVVGIPKDMRAALPFQADALRWERGAEGGVRLVLITRRAADDGPAAADCDEEAPAASAADWEHLAKWQRAGPEGRKAAMPFARWAFHSEAPPSVGAGRPVPPPAPIPMGLFGPASGPSAPSLQNSGAVGTLIGSLSSRPTAATAQTHNSTGVPLISGPSQPDHADTAGTAMGVLLPPSALSSSPRPVPVGVLQHGAPLPPLPVPSWQGPVPATHPMVCSAGPALLLPTSSESPAAGPAPDTTAMEQAPRQLPGTLQPQRLRQLQQQHLQQCLSLDWPLLPEALLDADSIVATVVKLLQFLAAPQQFRQGLMTYLMATDWEEVQLWASCVAHAVRQHSLQGVLHLLNTVAVPFGALLLERTPSQVSAAVQEPNPEAAASLVPLPEGSTSQDIAAAFFTALSTLELDPAVAEERDMLVRSRMLQMWRGHRSALQVLHAWLHNAWQRGQLEEVAQVANLLAGQ